MERIVSKGLIHADGTLDFQGELEGIDPSSYKNLEVFKGIAASTETTMNLFRHSDQALQQLAEAYSRGKGMYTDHYLKFSNRIGRTLKGTVNDNILEVIFGIRPNLDVSNSNDIISIIRDTGADLSASYYPESIKCGVEGCGKDMHAYGFFFFSWYECDDGHCVGDLYEDDDGNETRVTGIIDSIEDVVELSLVSVGANLDAEVTGEVQAQVADKVGDDLTFLRFLADANGLNFDNACLNFGIDNKPRRAENRADESESLQEGERLWHSHNPYGQASRRKASLACLSPSHLSSGNGVESRRSQASQHPRFSESTSLPTPKPNKDKTGGNPVPNGNIIKDFSNIDWSVIENSDSEDLLEIVREFAAHIEMQNATITEMKSAEEYEALATEFDAQQTELTQAKAAAATAAEKCDAYDAEVERLQDELIEKKQQLRSYSDNDPRLVEYAADIRKIKDINALRSKMIGHSNTIQAVGNVKAYMELKPPETSGYPEVKSDYSGR